VVDHQQRSFVAVVVAPGSWDSVEGSVAVVRCQHPAPVVVCQAARGLVVRLVGGNQGEGYLKVTMVVVWMGQTVTVEFQELD